MPTFRELVVHLCPPIGSAKLWNFRITEGEHCLFDSAYFSVRLKSMSAAQWLADLTSVVLQQADLRPVCDDAWTGTLDDDCHFDDEDFHAHAEWLSGPRRGGEWYCQVNGGANLTRYFHTADFSDIVPLSGAGARKLCALVIQAARLGLLKPCVE